MQEAAGSDNLREVGVERLLVRGRYLLFLLIVAFLAAAFNGQWRMGRDSALYRGLGREIAGQGVSASHSQGTALVLPGYPLMLAAMQHAFGDSVHRPVPQILVMVATAGLTLVLVYYLVQVHFAKWVAVLVTFMLGVNWKFIQHAHELMTDMPHLLGVVGALLGYAWLLRAREFWGRFGSSVLIVAGLGLAASMRPTFGAVALGWGLATIIQIIRRKDRLANGIALGLLVLLSGLVLSALLLREDGQAARSIERSLEARIRNISVHIAQQFEDESARGGEAPPWMKMLKHHFPEGFFGVEMWYFSIPVSIAVIAYGTLLARRNMLWGMVVLFGCLMFAIVGSAPRYFLMVMPLLLTGYVWINHALAGRITRRYHLDRLFFLGALGLVLVPGIGKSLLLVAEQHGLVLEGRWNRTLGDRPISWLPLRQVGFDRAYRGGQFVALTEISREIRRQVPADEAVIGPEPRILTYLSERRVLLLGDVTGSASAVAEVRAQKVKWVIWPPALYTKEGFDDPLTGEDLKHFDPTTWHFLDKEVVPAGLPKGAGIRLIELELKADRKPGAKRSTSRRSGSK